MYWSYFFCCCILKSKTADVLVPSRYKEFFTHRRALSIVVIRSQNRFVLLFLCCAIEPTSKLFFGESSQADTRDQHAKGDTRSRVLSPNEMRSFFLGSAPVKYLTSSSITLHIFVFFLRCSSPSFSVSTSVQLSRSSISYFTKHNSKSTPKNRQLRGLTETVIISQIPFYFLILP